MINAKRNQFDYAVEYNELIKYQGMEDFHLGGSGLILFFNHALEHKDVNRLKFMQIDMYIPALRHTHTYLAAHKITAI